MKRCALIVGAGLIVSHNAICLALDVLLLKKVLCVDTLCPCSREDDDAYYRRSRRS